MNKLPQLTLTLTAMLGFCALPAEAQYQLDNNLEQSSGAVNPQATNVDYGSRNDIIYGNINAGKGFRGNLDYGAPGDFRGNTGSDELYRFRANAASGATGHQLTSPQSVQRASHSAVLGNIKSYNGPNAGVISSSGIPVDAYRTGQATTNGQMIYTPEFGTSRAGTVGVQGDMSGRSLGIGATSAQSLGVPADTPVGAQDLRPNVVGGGYTNDQLTENPALLGALAAPSANRTSVGHGIAGTTDSLWKVDPSKNLAYPDSTAPATEEIILPAQQMPQNMLNPQSATEPGLSVEEKAARLQAQQMQLESSLMANPGDDAYMILQQNKENRQRISQGLQPIEHGVNRDNQLVADPAQVKQLPTHQSLYNSMTGTDMQQVDPQPGSNNGGIQPMNNAGIPGMSNTVNTDPMSSLLNPNASTNNGLSTPQQTAAERAEAQQKLQDAMLQSRGVEDSNNVLDQVIGVPSPSTRPEPVIPAGSSDARGATKPTGGLFDAPEGDSAQSIAAQDKRQADQVLLGNMGTSTGITVPATTLPHTAAASQREWHASQTLSQATYALKAGRYFDAERKFKSLLLGNPDSYEASAGLLCSQLGAGMVRVTSLTLRQHMTKFPQHLGHKLDTTLLPSGNRLAWVREQSENLMKQYGNYDAALLIAFMGYQTSDKQLLQYGLGLAQKHLPGDPLVEQLSRAWLGQ